MWILRGSVNDLDKKLLEAIYRGVSLNKLDKVPENSVNWFKATANGDVYEFVIDAEQIKQAFVEAGWVPEKFQLTDDEIERLAKAKVVNKTSLLTGKDWYSKFERELARIPVHIETERVPKSMVITAAQKASGIA